MFGYLHMPAAPDVAFTMDGQHFSVFVHNWRAEPVLQWMEIMGERELLDEIVALETLPHTPQPVALSEPEFTEAVRQALRDVRRTRPFIMGALQVGYRWLIVLRFRCYIMQFILRHSSVQVVHCAAASVTKAGVRVCANGSCSPDECICCAI
jgi:hypothetical protein